MFTLDAAKLEKGILEVRSGLERVATDFPDAWMGACYLLGTEVATRAMRYVPVDTGHLRESRFVTKPTFTGTAFELTVGFGEPYAIFVHERQARHVVGDWKFLARAADEVAATAEAFLDAKTTQLARLGLGIDSVPAHHPTQGQAFSGVRRKRTRLSMEQRLAKRDAWLAKQTAKRAAKGTR